MQNLKKDDLYAVRQVPSKGQGVVAAAKIVKGTRILSEAPMFTVPRYEASVERLRASISKQVNELSKVQQQTFFSMHNAYADDDKCVGIFRTNALPLSQDVEKGGIFLNACRINHSCLPNAQNTWNDSIKRLTIHAVKDIEEGEEITISYIEIYANRNSRQEALRKQFGFTCSCNLCSLSPDQSRKHDETLDEISRLDSLIGDGSGILSAPLLTLHYAHAQLDLLSKEGIADANVSRVYSDAMQIAAANGDLARASVFAKRASSARAVTHGNDNPTVIELKRLAQNPSTHPAYGYSMRWKTAVKQVPRGLGPDEFEGWLWKKEK